MDRKHFNSINTDSNDSKTKSEEKSLLHDNESKEEKGYNKETILGLIFAFLSVLLTALSKICVQALKTDVPHFFLNTLRCSAATVGIAILLICAKHIPQVECVDVKPAALYCVSGNMYGLSCYIPIVYIPLVTTEACTITTALLSSLIIFGLIKKEDIRMEQVRVTFNIK